MAPRGGRPIGAAAHSKQILLLCFSGSLLTAGVGAGGWAFLAPSLSFVPIRAECFEWGVLGSVGGLGFLDPCTVGWRLEPFTAPPPDRLVNGGRHTAEVSQGALGARWTGETPRALVCKTVWPTHPQVRGAHEDRAHPAPRAPRQLPAAGSSRGTARTSGLTLALSSGASSQYFAQRPPCREHPRAASALSATFMMRS